MPPAPDALFPLHTVVYWDDIETPERAAAARDELLASGVDAACFYMIREHEIAIPPDERTLRARLETAGGVAAELRGAGLEISAALLPSLGWGQAIEQPLPFQKIVGPNGERSGAGRCPLDPAVRSHLQAYARALVQAGFVTISLEDDFQLDNHRPVREGCFCPLHIDAFNAQTGCAYTRATLVDAVREDCRLRRTWRAFCLEGLCELAGELMATGREADPRCAFVLLAANNLAPLVERLPWKEWRPAQGCYGEDRFCAVQAAWQGQMQRLGVGKSKRSACLAEITGWPRNAYAKSWATLHAQTAWCAFSGFAGALLWTGFGHRAEGFVPFARDRRGWLEAVARAAREHPDPLGMALPVDPDSPRLSDGALCMARMGIPVYHVAYGEAAAQPLLGLFGPASLPPGAEHTAVAIDAQAILAAQGEPPAAGVTLQPAEVMLSADRFTEDACNGTAAGRFSTSLTLLPSEDMHLLRMHADARVLSEYVDLQSRPVGPSVLLDRENRRLILNLHGRAWPMLISADRSHQLRAALAALQGRPLPVAVTGAADTFVCARDGARTRVVLVYNTSRDAQPRWGFAMDMEPTRTELAGAGGEWREIHADTCPVRGRALALAPGELRLYRFTLRQDKRPELCRA